MSQRPPQQPDLFGTPPAPLPTLPPGLRYAPEFLDPGEEQLLLAQIQRLPLAPMRYQQYTALRRVLSYGGEYDFTARRLEPGEPLPDWLAPLQARAAAWAGVAPDAFEQALVAEYRPGTPLGWHRDVPEFEDIVGVSLAAEALMRLRPYPPQAPRKADVLRLTLAPRSIYLLRGAARWNWQHSVAPTQALRFSITLRTRRRPAPGP